MKLDLRMINRSSNIQLLSISGKIDNGYITPLTNEFARLCQGPAVRLILNIDGAEGINGSGISELIKARNEIIERGGKVVLMGVNSRVETMINISGLHQYFPIVGSESEAVEFLTT